MPLYNACLEAYHKMPQFNELEFIFVEDCGPDDTWINVANLAKSDQRVKAMRLSRNFGQHHALTACLDFCTGDWVVTMDCDMQDNPEKIPVLWQKAQEGYDMVCARRINRRDSFFKRFTSRCFTWVFNSLSGMHYDGSVSNFRMISKKVVLALRKMGEATRNIATQLKWLGFKVAYVDVVHSPRYDGVSSYSLVKLINFALDSIIAYSDRPMRIFCSMGFTITGLSLLYALYLGLRKIIWGTPILGWTSLITSIWLLGGLVIGCLGILGLYIGRIYNETKRRPIYVIDEHINI